jgi:hypothetical protein
LAADWQLVRLNPDFLLARQSPIADSVHTNACSFEHGRNEDLGPVESGFEAVDYHLVLIKLNLAEAPLPARPRLAQGRVGSQRSGVGM